MVIGICSSVYNKALVCLKSHISQRLLFFKKKKKKELCLYKWLFSPTPENPGEKLLRPKMALEDKFCIFT